MKRGFELGGGSFKPTANLEHKTKDKIKVIKKLKVNENKKYKKQKLNFKAFVLIG